MTITQSSTRFVAMTLGVAAVVAIALSVAIATPAQAAGVCPGTTFSVTLKMGQTNADVMKLQQFLNLDPDTMIASTGVGSKGSESSYFGAKTKAAVNKFQQKYAAQILTPAGLKTPTGLFGAASRAQANSLCSGSTGTGTTGTTGSTVPVTGNGLKVVLSPDSPNNVALVQGQAAGVLAKYTFVNPTNAAIMVTNVAFKRIGVSNDTTMTNVYLFNGAVRLTDSAGVTNSAFSFNNPSGLFTVPAGGTYTVSVDSDIANSTSGQQIGVQMVSVGATGTLDTGTSFPINSFTQTISAATLGGVDFGGTTLPGSTTVDPQADYTVWQNTVNISTRAVTFKSFALRNIGSIQSGDVVNYRLYVDGVQAGAAVAAMDSNSMVTFDLSASPVTLQTGGRVIKVLADIVGGASRTFQFSLRYPSDAIMIDSNLGQPVLPTAAGATFSARSATSETINSITSSAPSVTKASGSPTSNVAVGSSNVKWASFSIIANGEPVKIDNLNVNVNTSVTNGGLSNGAVFFNGVQVGSTKNLAEGDTNFTFGSSLVLPQGKVSTIDIYADAKTSTSSNLVNGETVQVSLNSTSAGNGQGNVSLQSVTVPASIVSGNIITAASSNLGGTKASGYGNQTVIAGSTNSKIGSFTLSAGSTEGINVNTIDVGFASAVSSTFTNMILKDSTGAQIGTSKSTVGQTNSYSVNFTIPASGSKTIDVFADVKTAAQSGPVNALVKYDTSGTGASTGNSVQVALTSSGDVSLQTMTVAGSGTLSGSVAAGNPVNANVIAGSSAVKVGQFTFAAQSSPFTIQNLMVEIPNNAATSVADVTIKYKDSTGTQQTVTQPVSTSPTLLWATTTFTGLTAYVPMNDSADIEVWVDTPTVASGATSGAAISARIDATSVGFKAVDAAGNPITTFNSGVDLNSAATAGYGTMYLKKSFPTFAKATSGLTATVSSGQPLYKFTLTADSNGAIDWNKISFTVSTTSVQATGWILYDVTGGGNTAVSASTEANASNIVAITTNATGNIQQVGAGTTKTYQLVPTTVSGWGGAGDAITVTPTQDATAVTNAAVSGLSTQNFIWSDRSASNHASTGTAATDWTNGYLVKDFTTSSTYSCQFGTVTTCN